MPGPIRKLTKQELKQTLSTCVIGPRFTPFLQCTCEDPKR